MIKDFDIIRQDIRAELAAERLKPFRPDAQVHWFYRDPEGDSRTITTQAYRWEP